MKRSSSLIAAVLLLTAACAGGSPDTSSKATTSTGEEDLNILELKCRDTQLIDGSRVDVQPGRDGTLQATLLTNEGEASLTCTPLRVTGDDGLSRLLVQCVESPSERPTNWTVEITSESDGRQSARIEQHQIGEVVNSGPKVGEGVRIGQDLACSRITSEIPVLPYSVVGGYIHRACGACHGEEFESLEKVRAQRDLMFGMISGGIMPKRNPSWRTSDEGQLTLAFLAKSPELE